MKLQVKSLIMVAYAIALSVATLPAVAQRQSASAGRAEYIEVEPNVKLHVTDMGEGKPVVLIHGWPLSDAMYEYQYMALVEAGIRVIGITLRGYGQSDKPYGRYNINVFADDLKVILKKLDIENATLGGFSMGGAVVVRYMAKYNGAHVSKLALFGAAVPVWTKRPDFAFGLWAKDDVNNLIALNKTDRPALLATFGGIFAATPDALTPGMAQWLGGINIQASAYAMQEGLKDLRDADLRDDLKKINVPTLILHGKQDHICSYDLAEQTKALIKNSELIPFEKSGHALFVEEREKFNNALIAFAKK